MKTQDLYESGYVDRWHNKPHIPAQTTGQHTFGMLLLLIKLHPNPSAELFEAVIRHDSHEFIFGDMPSTAKNKYPEIRDIEVKEEREFWNEFEDLDLTESDCIWLALLDQLEVYHYMRLLRRNGDDEIEHGALKNAQAFARKLFDLGFNIESFG